MEAPFNPTADPRPPNWGIFGATSEEILRAIDTRLWRDAGDGVCGGASDNATRPRPSVRLDR